MVAAAAEGLFEQKAINNSGLILQNLDSTRVLVGTVGTVGTRHQRCWDSKRHLHTPKAVTYHEQSHYCRFMIGHRCCLQAILIYNW